MASVSSRSASSRQNLTSGHVRFGAFHEIQEVIDGLVEQIALIDCDGTILAVNESWRWQVERQARSGLRISRDYAEYLASLIEAGDEGVRPILEAFQAICVGSRQTFRHVYSGSGVFEGYDFRIIIAALSVQDVRCVLVSVHDVTELVALKRQRRRIGSQLLRAQELERRRIARELHDSTAQMLVVLQLDLSHLARNADPATESGIASCSEMVQQIQQEIRTFSFLAHPPELEANNLAHALGALARGFAARTGLEIEVDLCECGELSASVEAAMYRISQEALANIHRHAGAKHATVRLIARRYLHLTIGDDGNGFDPVASKCTQKLGVGVIGMRERLRELGGRLWIDRKPTGTSLTVSLPHQKRMLFEPSIGPR